MDATIKTFVKRGGRISDTNLASYEALSPIFCAHYDESVLLDYAALFKNDNPVVMEIGFGMGASLAKMAGDDGGKNFLGVEVHKPGVAKLLRLISENALQNLRIIEHDAREVLANMCPDDGLDAIHAFFCDPWPKKKHHKRRLMQAGNIALMAQKLRQGGYIHFATDNEDYAKSALMEFGKVGALEGASDFSPRPAWRPITKFEQRALEAGRKVFDIHAVKKAG